MARNFGIAVLNQMINESFVRCPSTVNCQVGDVCGWSGKLNELDAHLALCQYVMVQCTAPACKEKFQKKHQARHEAKCQFCQKECEFCNRVYLGTDLKAHQSQCGMRHVPCTNFCEKLVPYVELEYHLINECVKQPIPCPLFNMEMCSKNCDGKIERGRLNEHLGSVRGRAGDAIQKLSQEVVDLTARIETDTRDTTFLRLQHSLLKLTNATLTSGYHNHDGPPPYRALTTWVNRDLELPGDLEAIELLDKQLQTKFDFAKLLCSVHHVDFEYYNKDFNLDKPFNAESGERMLLPGITASIHVEREHDKMIKFYGKLTGYDGDYDCVTTLLRIGKGKPFRGESKVLGGM
jgi:hypothetical protein